MKIEPFKIKVTPEQSMTVQEVLFANGYTWSDGSVSIQPLTAPYLFFNIWHIIPELTWSCNIDTFSRADQPELTFEQFKQKYMNTRTFTVQVPDGYEIDKEKSTFEQIVFKAVDKLPRKWEDLKTVKGYFISHLSNINATTVTADYNNRNVFPTREYAEAALALAQLLQLRQAWIGEWKPDWKNSHTKYCVGQYQSNMMVFNRIDSDSLLSFPTDDMANDFLTTFKDLLETAKPLL